MNHAVEAVPDPRAEKIGDLKSKYVAQGFDVFVDPRPEDLPFDMFGYRPDILARRGSEGYLVTVRESGMRLSVDRFREYAAEVKRHPGWRLILVTADDVAPDEVPGPGDPLPSWQRIRERAAAAGSLAQRGESREAAFLGLWAVLEAVLRKLAEQVALPVERLPSSGVIRHLYSHGEISVEQFNVAIELLDVRKRVIHGYEAPGLEESIRRLASLVKELLRERVEKAA